MGKTFYNLSGRTNHPQVSFLSETFKAIVFMSTLRQFKVPERLVPFFLPKGLYFKRMSHLRSVFEWVDQCMAENPDRPDFLPYILGQNKEKGMVISELKANASLFVGAGSFSTATVLCGAIYHLYKILALSKPLLQRFGTLFSLGKPSRLTVSLTQNT